MRSMLVDQTEDIAAAIARRRRQLGFSQQQLEQYAGLAATLVNKFEHGSRRPTARHLRALEITFSAFEATRAQVAEQLAAAACTSR
jgi:transcriptional regulator with XRE-family HTH domain